MGWFSKDSGYVYDSHRSEDDNNDNPTRAKYDPYKDADKRANERGHDKDLDNTPEGSWWNS